MLRKKRKAEEKAEGLGERGRAEGKKRTRMRRKRQG
jgi:hypothetical protein